MVKLVVDLPEDLDNKLQILKIKLKKRRKADVIVEILKKVLKDE